MGQQAKAKGKGKGKGQPTAAGQPKEGEGQPRAAGRQGKTWGTATCQGVHLSTSLLVQPRAVDLGIQQRHAVVGRELRK